MFLEVTLKLSCNGVNDNIEYYVVKVPMRFCATFSIKHVRKLSNVYRLPVHSWLRYWIHC